MIEKNRFFDGISNDPIHKLLFAVLERAIMNLVTVTRSYNPSNAARAAGLNALAWIKSSDNFGVNSYLGVCDAINLDPALLRNDKTLNRVVEYYLRRHYD